jgi:hypothetical protein
MRDHNVQALENARKLRKAMSLPEVLLWQRLRGGHHGVKLRRQHPIGSYVLISIAQLRVPSSKSTGSSIQWENDPRQTGAAHGGWNGPAFMSSVSPPPTFCATPIALPKPLSLRAKPRPSVSPAGCHLPVGGGSEGI